VTNLPALDAAPLGVSLRVGGLFDGFFRARGASGGWALRVDKGKEFPAYFLRAWADAMPLPEALRFLQGPACLLVRDPKKDAASESREVPAFAPAKAREILFGLLSDYAAALGGEGSLEDLPLARIEAVLKDAGFDAEAVSDWPQALLDARRAMEEAPLRVTARDQLLRAIDAGVSSGAAEAVRRRALPYLEWKRALYARPDARNGEEDA
jgi:hypothetical protein